MKKWLVSSSVLVVLIVLAVITVQAKPNAPGEDLSTGFTYQGQLNLDGQPVDNTCDLQFSLYDDELGTCAGRITHPFYSCGQQSRFVVKSRLLTFN
jgi:hypothetical protein